MATTEPTIDSKQVILKNLYRNGNKVPMMFRNGELIYQMLLKLVFEVDTNSISFDAEGGTQTINITANDDWVMTVPSWITASALSGTTSATITLTTQSTEENRNGNVTITCGTKTHNIVVNQSIEFVLTGYLNVTQSSLIITDFNVGNEYSRNNYLRFEFNADLNSTTYLWSTPTTWFSFERNGTSSYCNVGDSTVLCGDSYIVFNTTGLSTTNVFTYDNRMLNCKNTNINHTYAWTGSIPNGVFRLFTTGGNQLINFYRLKVFNSPNSDTPIYDFAAAKDDNNTPCIFETINKTYLYPSTSGGMTFIPF